MKKLVLILSLSLGLITIACNSSKEKDNTQEEVDSIEESVLQEIDEMSKSKDVDTSKMDSTVTDTLNNEGNAEIKEK